MKHILASFFLFLVVTQIATAGLWVRVLSSDANSVSFEFAPRKAVREQKVPKSYINEPAGYFTLEAGVITRKTGEALAVASLPASLRKVGPEGTWVAKTQGDIDVDISVWQTQKPNLLKTAEINIYSDLTNLASKISYVGDVMNLSAFHSAIRAKKAALEGNGNTAALAALNAAVSDIQNDIRDLENLIRKWKRIEGNKCWYEAEDAFENIGQH